MTGSSIHVSVRNNLNLLNNRKRDKFKNLPKGFKYDKKTQYNLPNASKKQLRHIRKRMQAERKLWLIYTVTLTAFIAGVGICIILQYA